MLVYRQMPQQSLESAVNIMLPPQFYTLKKETLPIKYHFQVKKIAPSLFEGLVEEKEKYEYFVYKDEEAWVFIAYNPEEIHDFLESKGIKAEQVSKLFFAEQAKEVLVKPIALGEKNALATINGTVVMIPRSALKEENVATQMPEEFIPQQGISLESAFHSFLSQKQAIGLSLIFFLFALTFFVEGWRYGLSSESLKTEITALLDEHPSLQSQYKRRSIAAKYQAIDLLERHKRDIIKTLSGMIFKGVKVDTFTMDDKKFTIRFKCADAKVTKHLRELAHKEGFKTVKTLTGNIVSIEESL